MTLRPATEAATTVVVRWLGRRWAFGCPGKQPSSRSVAEQAFDVVLAYARP
jgi:hypothetical protein